jgi:hypothetical protein
MVEEIHLMRASFTARLPVPPEVAFEVLADVTQTHRWRERIHDVAWLDEGPTRVGRRFRGKTTWGPWRRLGLGGDVTVYEPPHRFAYRITEGPLRAENEYRLEPDTDGSTFTMTGGAGMPGPLIRVLGPVLRRASARTARRELRQLARLLG